MKSKVLSDRAYNILKNHIITLEQGVHISAREFAARINMSYTPVREAFLRLCSEGFLKLIPNVGFFVQSLDILEVIQIYDARKCMEPYVLDHAFKLLDKAHFDQIEECIKVQRQILDKREIRIYMEQDIKLHTILFEAYDNKYLIDFYKTLRGHHLYCSNKTAESLSDEANNEAVLEHKELLRMLRSGEKEVAVAFLRQHIENSEQRMKIGYTKINNGE